MENNGAKQLMEMLRMERGKTYLDKKICMTGKELIAIMGSVDAVIIQELTGKDPDKAMLEKKALEAVKMLPHMFKQINQ